MSNTELIKEMFDAHMHLGYSRTRRHPSVIPFIFTTKTRGDIIDLEKTAVQMTEAMAAIEQAGSQKSQILFVGTKPEARNIVRSAAERIDMPFVDNRWVGGTLTNFGEIRKRVNRLMDLEDRQEKGELVYQTKKELLMLEREITKLRKNFGGLTSMTKLPAMMVIVDPLHEDIAVKEALALNIPIVALSNSDGNIDPIAYPVVGNDSHIHAVQLFTKKLTQSYEAGNA